MLAYRIEINGEPLLVAGFPDWDTLHVSLVASREEGERPLEFHFNVGGLVRSNGADKLEHVRWRVPELEVGDTVSISIVDVGEVDDPTRRYRSDAVVQEDPFTPEEIEEFERRDYERLRKKFEGTR